MLKEHFRTYFEAAGDVIGVTAHSHHPWPDVTRAAHLAYWDDSARLTNDKWSRVFGEVVPEAQGHIARHLGLADPRQIAFAPNTTEFVARLYSALDWSRPLHVVTTGSEFHAFGRITRRLEETGRLRVTRVPTDPFESFPARLIAAVRAPADFVFFSQVFFDSGYALRDLARIVAAIPPGPLVAVDGYHAFFAIDVDLGPIADRAFYMAGGYKYAQAGEGACFMVCPPTELRPVLTGWFSDFGALSGASDGPIGYGEGAMRWWGSTFDASGLYRLNAVMRLYRDLGVDVAAIRAHVAGLQDRFLDQLARARLRRLPVTALVPGRTQPRGNFCTFDLDDAEDVAACLRAAGVIVDRRVRRLRFGFGVHHDAADVDRVIGRAVAALEPAAAPV